MDYIQVHGKQGRLDPQALSANTLGLQGTESFREHNVSQSASPVLLRSEQKLSTSHRLLSSSTNFNAGCVSTSHESSDHLVKEAVGGFVELGPRNGDCIVLVSHKLQTYFIKKMTFSLFLQSKRAENIDSKEI